MPWQVSGSVNRQSGGKAVVPKKKGPPVVVPFLAVPFLVGRVPLLQKTTEKELGTLILTSLLEDLGQKMSPT